MSTDTQRITATEPVTADWKISQVIQRYPSLLEVLIDTAPAFEKLRNPLLRRVQSRLVTVGQAAAIAGLEPSFLVDQLNAGIGISSRPHEPETANTDLAMSVAPPWVTTATIAAELDVRPYQKRGEEPFSAIMEAVRNVPTGEVFLLLNTFEPTPLYGVLGQRGFEHWSEQVGENDWKISFFNAGLVREQRQSKSDPSPATAPASWDEPTATLTIDVSELVPPEPMVRILTALEELPDGASLLVHHVRRPMHLYPRLDELGYRHETRDIGPAKVEVLVEKPAAAAEKTA